MASAPAWLTAAWRDGNLKTHVSLLPPEIKSKRLIQEKLNKVLRLVTLLLAVVLVVYSAMFFAGVKLRGDVKKLQKDRAAVELEAAVLEEYAVMYEQLNAAEEKINQAMGTVPHWINLFQDISFTMPHNVWLMEVAANYDHESGEILIRGWAYEHSDVAAFLEHLHTLESITEVRCQISASSIVGGQDVTRFSIQARILTGPPFLEVSGGGD